MVSVSTPQTRRDHTAILALLAEADKIATGLVEPDEDDGLDDLVECAQFNWVEKVGGLPRYIKRIKKHLVRKGMTEGHAIAVAVNVVKKMCATGDINYPGKQNVNPKSRAEACKAVAEWEAKKARSKAKHAADDVEEFLGDHEAFRDYSPEARLKLVKEGKALPPDGAYPIVTVQDLRNAIQAVGRAKDPEKVRAHIRKRARALGKTDLLPEGFAVEDPEARPSVVVQSKEKDSLAAEGSPGVFTYTPEIQKILTDLRDQYARMETLDMTSQEYRDVAEESLASFQALQDVLKPLGADAEEMLLSAETAAEGLITFLNVDWPEQMAPEDELAARTETFSSFNPDQLRVPRGNGELSGRWIDTPWKALTDLHAELTANDRDPGFRAPRVKASLDRVKLDLGELRRSDIGTPEHMTDVEKSMADLEKLRDDLFNYLQLPDGPLAAVDEAHDKLADYQRIIFPPDYDIKNLPVAEEGAPDVIDNSFPETNAPTPVPAAPLGGSAMASVLRGPGTPEGRGTPDDPIDVQGDLLRAAQLLAEGKSVRLNSIDEVGTLLNELAAIANDAKARGEKAPLYDLCKVSVPGTNLFCAQSKGIPRAKMPQLGGQAVPGTRADALPRVRGDEVDITEQFTQELERLGVGLTPKQVPASSLKATQNELIGAKVAGIMKAMETAPPDSGLFAPIFVTRDHYVIDGHHRWAAEVGLDAQDGKLGDVMMNVIEIDMEIGEAIDFTNAYALDFGIAQVGVLARRRGRGQTMAAGTQTFSFNPKQLRVPRGNGDLSGRWIDTPWQVLDSLLNGEMSRTQDPGIVTKVTQERIALLKRDAKDMAASDIGSPAYGKAVDNARTDLDLLSEAVFNYADDDRDLYLAQIQETDDALRQYQEILFPADYDVKALPKEPPPGADIPDRVMPVSGDPLGTGGAPQSGMDSLYVGDLLPGDMFVSPYIQAAQPVEVVRTEKVPGDQRMIEWRSPDGSQGVLGPVTAGSLVQGRSLGGPMDDAMDNNGFDDTEPGLEDDWMQHGDPGPDGIWVSAAQGLNAALVASAAPVKPPKKWFSDPKFTGPTALTVTEDGQVYGHLAAWDTCHIGQPEGPGTCTRAPHSAMGYAYFHVGAIFTAEGDEIPVGHITLDTSHAGPKLNAMAALAHYENTGTVVADVRAGEDKFGIWVAGAARPGLTEATLRALRAAPLSGDWRRMNGNLELIAALAVNVGGFPIPRPAGLVAAGNVQSLVASGMVPHKTISRETFAALSEDDLKYLKQLAARERERVLKEKADELRATVQTLAAKKDGGQQ